MLHLAEEQRARMLRAAVEPALGGILKRVRMSRVVTLCLASFATFACSQGEGETCQVNRDCSTGLLCCREGSAVRGVCTMPTEGVACTVAATTTDAGSATRRDASSDANMSVPADAAGGSNDGG
jgi:hypothetical protein